MCPSPPPGGAENQKGGETESEGKSAGSKERGDSVSSPARSRCSANAHVFPGGDPADPEEGEGSGGEGAGGREEAEGRRQCVQVARQTLGTH